MHFRAALVTEGFFVAELNQGVCVSAPQALYEHSFVVGLPPHVLAELASLARRRQLLDLFAEPVRHSP